MGVPQSSVLGLLLSNIIYYNGLYLPVTEEAREVGYACNITLALAAKYLEDVELHSCQAINAVVGSLGSVVPALK